MSRVHGITTAELVALSDPPASRLFSEAEQVALAYAEAITLANAVSDELFEPLRRHFSVEEIIELTATISWEICAAKFNRALDL